VPSSPQPTGDSLIRRSKPGSGDVDARSAADPSCQAATAAAAAVSAT
jgi:hypothetical protein